MQNQNKPKKQYFTQHRPPPSPTMDFHDLDPKTGQIIPHKSRTKQSFAKEADINNIIANLNQGILPEMRENQPSYGDFADPITYQESMNLIIHAREQFEALPSRVRERFMNDPQRFLEFATNPENGEELVRLGLAEKTKEPEKDPYLETLKEINQNVKQNSGKTAKKGVSTESE